MVTVDGNYPNNRGEKVDVPVCDIEMPDDELVYMARENSSGYFWIGLRKNLPENLHGAMVRYRYRRTVDQPGEVLVVEGKKDKRLGTSGSNSYWNWHEFDKSAPPLPKSYDVSPEGAERLLISMVRDAAAEYRNDINRELKQIPCTHERDIWNAIKEVRRLDRIKIDFLKGTGRGEYILKRIEDEAAVKAMCPFWEDMDYKERADYVDAEVRKLHEKRVRRDESKHYAKIKGRSVKR